MSDLFQMDLTNEELSLPINDGGKKCIESPVAHFTVQIECIFRAEMASIYYKERFHGALCGPVWERMLWLSQLLALVESKAYYWLAFTSSLLQCRRIDLGCSLPRALL